MWPEPVSAKKPIPERVPAAPVQVTVQSMIFFLKKWWLGVPKLDRDGNQARLRLTVTLRLRKLQPSSRTFFHFDVPILLHCNKSRLQLRTSVLF
jgi:hypothetical protein